MQVREVLNEKLKREYQVCVPAALVNEKIEAFLLHKGKTARIRGYSRPGKAPLSILRQHFLKDALNHAIEKALEEGYTHVLKAFQIAPAFQPKYDLQSFKEGGDLEYRLRIEVAPQIPEISWGGETFCRYTAIIDEALVENTLETMAASHNTSRPYPTPRTAQRGDTVIADVEMKPPSGGAESRKMEGFAIELADGAFIQELVDALVGVQSGDVREVPWLLPDTLAGKRSQRSTLLVTFTVRDVQETVPFQVSEDFAAALECDSLIQLRERVRKDLEVQGNEMAFLLLKRQFLDHLAAAHTFDVHQDMVGTEFNLIWKEALKAWGLPATAGDTAGGVTGFDPPPEQREEIFKKESGQTEAELVQTYQQLAERRVRLALILRKIAAQHHIALTPEERAAVISEKVKQFPGQEMAAVDYYKKNPSVVEMLMQPTFERKVVEFALSTAHCEEKAIPFKELEALCENTSFSASDNEHKATQGSA